MTPQQVAHLEIAKEIYLNFVKETDLVKVAKMIKEDSDEFRKTLHTTAAIAYEMADAFTSVYKATQTKNE